jgi:hypothetical protein
MTKEQRKPGTVREGRFPIVDGHGNVRGNVGSHANAATVARFVPKNGAAATLKYHPPLKRTCWVCPPLADVSAMGTDAGAPAGQGSTPSLAASLRAGKGSNK